MSSASPATTTTPQTDTPTNKDVDVLIIGAGQAGLSAAYNLQKRGFVQTQASTNPRVNTNRGPAADSADAPSPTFDIIDANPGPGGAWQHRWDSLTMETVNNIYDLPGMPQAEVDPQAKASTTLISYFDAFEKRFGLHVRRPVRATSVENLPSEAPSPTSPKRLITSLDDGSTITSSFLVNATGTWTSPHIPYIPGMEKFQGRIIHTQGYRGAEEFAGQKVAIVGAGISATGHLAEVSKVAETTWFTRRPPEYREDFNGHDSVALVEERVRKGLPPQSVVSVTGLGWKPYMIDARDRGVLVPHPMFVRMDATGVFTPDGGHLDFDAIIFGTGFRWEMRHLAPLHLRNELGGITLTDPPQVADDPRIYLVGYGPSASTVGANRAGRDAAISIRRQMRNTKAQK
nr:FAD-dependent oxidoreductase [Corynebacterium lactis]